MEKYNYETYSENFTDQKTNILHRPEGEIHIWFEIEKENSFELEVTILSFQPANNHQGLLIKYFQAEGILGGDEVKKDFFVLPAEPLNIGRKSITRYYPVKNKKKRPILVRIAHEFFSDVPNASFNPGETHRYAVGNSGMLIEANEDNTEFLCRSNSGDHPNSAIPKFDDIVFSVKVKDLT